MAAVFLDRTAPPSEAAVDGALGAAGTLWRAARRRIAAEHGPIEEEWAWSGKVAGWSLRLKRKGRAVVYLTPWQDECRVGFALGERAVELARAERLPGPILELIETAPRYPEGRGVRFVLREPADLEVLATLARIKLAS